MHSVRAGSCRFVVFNFLAKTEIMYFSFALYTFATALVLVQGEEFDHKEPDGPHKYTDLANCKNEGRMELISNRMKAMLMPRERHVILNAQPGYEFMPRTVSIKRCNGFCPARWSPMPTKTEPKSFIVNLRPEGDRMPMKCVSVELEEHMSCKCKCMKTAEDCNASQQWDGPNCACHCKDRKSRKLACEGKREMVWNDEDCSCQCRTRIMDCRSGLMWNTKICMCVLE